MSKEENCFVCNGNAIANIDTARQLKAYECPICGKYELSIHESQFTFDKNHLASYLYYHNYDDMSYRYNTVLDKESCDNYNTEFSKGHNICGRPVHMNNEMVESWYPKSFSEKIDMVMLFINGKIKHVGQSELFSLEMLTSMFFVDRCDINHIKYSGKIGFAEWRKHAECFDEVRYFIDCLENMKYIVSQEMKTDDGFGFIITILPNGYKRIDELQKNSSNSKNVMVAMEFKGTERLREAIRNGIELAGYKAILIDEVPHNDFITPELLKQIRDCNFMVVDLTHNNNGAYFEEGYAMGLGKTVIQLCKDEVKMHFDIAQKNTVMWKTEEEIPKLLSNRILATIG